MDRKGVRVNKEFESRNPTKDASGVGVYFSRIHTLDCIAAAVSLEDSEVLDLRGNWRLYSK